MHFHHLHFYVEDVAFWQTWFIRKLAFRPDSVCEGTHVLRQGAIEVRLSAGDECSHYLQAHPSGLVDVGLATDDFDRVLTRSLTEGAVLLSKVTVNRKGQRQCQLKGWGDLRHTLVEVSSQWISAQLAEPSAVEPPKLDWLWAIDHVVLNVPDGELAEASDWYQRIFGLVTGQQFDITTSKSGLRSQVLVHPQGTLQLPINEPTSENSQVQEFLKYNRGPGIQHVALRSRDAVGAIAQFRQQGLELISVPNTYYEGLHKRPDCPAFDTSAARDQQLLLDWAEGGQQGLLLQTFTKPIFAEPTFFFEIIERGTYIENGQTFQAQGFGAGNFQALFEAIERAQITRGSLG